MCKYFSTIGLNLSKKFTANQLSSFKIYIEASLQSVTLDLQTKFYVKFSLI